MGPRILVCLGVATLVAVACAAPDPSPPPQDAIRPSSAPDVAAMPTIAATPAPTLVPPLYTKLRVFVASESTDQVWVLEGEPGREYAVVTKINVGRLPHQLAVSPDGRWVAVNNRMANSTSIIDAASMTEVKRLMVGRQPHAILWSSDSKTLFVGHERDMHIARFEAATWKPLARLDVGAPQHVFAMSRTNPNELWFSLTNTTQGDVLRVYHLDTGKVTRIPVSDVHDVYFSPDETEVWSSSSGFLDKPSDRIVVYEPRTKKVKNELRFPGRYPFHTQKVNQDGVFYLTDRSLMVLSDHVGPSLIWLDWRERQIVGETKLGKQPFHTTYDPEGGRLLTTTNVDGMVNVIDVRSRTVLQRVAVPKAHGIGAVPVN